MYVYFYQNLSDDRVINKNIIKMREYNGVRLRDEIDIVNPVLEIGDFSDLGEFVNINYCFVPRLGRYYFITSIKMVKNIYEIYCHCDVLYTYKKDILSTTQMIGRIEDNDKNNLFIADSNLPIHCDKSIKGEKINGSPFNNNGEKNKAYKCLVLKTTGKGGV